MKIKNLIKLLGTKDQNIDAEFIVCSKAGAIVCMEMENTATDVVKALKLFKQKITDKEVRRCQNSKQ